jgi:ketosteroid isomerase-like protein
MLGASTDAQGWAVGDDEGLGAAPAAERRLAELERRIRQLEDERDIHHLLVAYGFAVDSGDPDATAALYADDARTVIDHAIEIHGSAGMHAMVLGPEHQAIIPGAAHVMGPMAISVDGDTAVAVGYATTFTRVDGAVGVWRQSVNRWRLERRLDGWRIIERESRSLDDPTAAELLRQGLPPTRSASGTEG